MQSILLMGILSVYIPMRLNTCTFYNYIYIEVNIWQHEIIEEVSTATKNLPYKYYHA
jgi:hypothetical protein